MNASTRIAGDLSQFAGLEQIFRFALVGLGINLVGYAIYLLLTWLGGDPKATMTALYILGTVLSFTFNRQWTFQHKGAALPAFGRFAGVYAAGYLLNWALLFAFVDQMGYAHQWVQFFAMFIVAAFLFTLSHLFAFR